MVDSFNKLSAESGVFITGSLSYTATNILPIHYVNVMPHEVKIYRNQLIGFFEHIHTGSFTAEFGERKNLTCPLQAGPATQQKSLLLNAPALLDLLERLWRYQKTS